MSSTGSPCCSSLQKRSSKLTTSSCGSIKTERIDVRAPVILKCTSLVLSKARFAFANHCILMQRPYPGVQPIVRVYKCSASIHTLSVLLVFCVFLTVTRLDKDNKSKYKIFKWFHLLRGKKPPMLWYDLEHTTQCGGSETILQTSVGQNSSTTP